MGRRSQLWCALGLGVIVTGLACKSDKEDPSAAFIASYCDVYRPCCMAAGMPADGAACRAQFTSSLSPQARYDARMGDRCIAELQRLAGQAGFCAGDIVEPSACVEAFGSMAGGGCVQDSDCPPSDQGEVHCLSGTMNGKPVHQCQVQTRGQLGSTPCVGSVRGGVTEYSGTSDGSIPAMGILCDAADGLRCDGTACVAVSATGETCSGVAGECIDGDFCDVTTGTCAARKPIGTACIDQALECTDGAYCDTAGMTCAAQRDVGAACTDNGQCLTANCAADGTCAATPTGGGSIPCGT